MSTPVYQGAPGVAIADLQAAYRERRTTPLAVLEQLLPRIAAAALVRTINTAPYFGFVTFLPFFFTEKIGFTQQQYLLLITIMGLVGMSFNPIVGRISDRLGWRRVLTFCSRRSCGLCMLSDQNASQVFMTGLLTCATSHQTYVP